jgi:hypothetical protein
VVAHEVMHSLHKSKELGVIIKLDYEKAYDRVNLDFLFGVLRTRGFSETWLAWIRMLVLNGAVNVMANGEESSTFKTGKGLRQGDPLSPLLFNLVGDVLNKMIKKVAGKKHVMGLLESCVPRVILALQYTDDTLLFSSSDTRNLRNLKIVLKLFERVSGMKINLNKSEFIPLNLEDGQIHDIAHVLCCPIGALPFRYIGVPIHFENLKREDLQPVLDKLIKKVVGWRDRLLAYSSRLELIRSCLSSIPIYLLSFMKFPKWAIKLLESQMAHCLWNSNSVCHRYHLASCQCVTMKKEYGGLGIPNMRELNLFLLSR